MSKKPSDTEILIERAGQGDAGAGQELLVRFQDRLMRMVAVRLDKRLVARVDPADIVQEALLDAALNLEEYLQNQAAALLSLAPAVRVAEAEQAASPSPGNTTA